MPDTGLSVADCLPVLNPNPGGLKAMNSYGRSTHPSQATLSLKCLVPDVFVANSTVREKRNNIQKNLKNQSSFLLTKNNTTTTANPSDDKYKLVSKLAKAISKVCRIDRMNKDKWLGELNKLLLSEPPGAVEEVIDYLYYNITKEDEIPKIRSAKTFVLNYYKIKKLAIRNKTSSNSYYGVALELVNLLDMSYVERATFLSSKKEAVIFLAESMSLIESFLSNLKALSSSNKNSKAECCCIDMMAAFLIKHIGSARNFSVNWFISTIDKLWSLNQGRMLKHQLDIFDYLPSLSNPFFLTKIKHMLYEYMGASLNGKWDMFIFELGKVARHENRKDKRLKQEAVSGIRN